MKTILLDNIVTVIVSVVVTIATISATDYLDGRKLKLLEQISSYDERKALLGIWTIQASISFMMYIFLAIDGGPGKIYGALISIVIIFLVSAFMISSYKKYIKMRLRDFKKNWSFIFIISLIFIIWIVALFTMYNIEEWGDKFSKMAYILILSFYSNLLVLKIYVKMDSTRVVSKLVVYATNGNKYSANELIDLGSLISIYSKNTGKRVLLPYEQIERIEYEYSLGTVTDFIDDQDRSK